MRQTQTAPYRLPGKERQIAVGQVQAEVAEILLQL
jgi:hypothetical protein